MSQNLTFDVALSYSNRDVGIARDLYGLIASSGLSVYSYEAQPDRAAGFLRSHLLDIYRGSLLNVVLWSREYAWSESPDVTEMERRCIANRHVEIGPAESLFLLRVDGEPMSRELDTVLAHDLRAIGLFAASRLILERIRTQTAAKLPRGWLLHPIGTESSRGRILPCTFTIRADYQRDPLNRWHKLADVLVSFPGAPNKTFVYLIPSDACSPLLRHSALLKTQPELLERKRAATEAFVSAMAGAPIDGGWFTVRVNEREVVTVYSPQYDQALNASLEQPLRTT